ncbi:uridine kinase family protein [Propionibacteriaceae bacterium G1746]|uniref:uridine kinase family protein n=1 Tax=Aestuariimicrobium sp. G57 TaxID=3418485 RepID=UPI003C2511C7
MIVPDAEPEAGPWAAWSIPQLVDHLMPTVRPSGRPVVIAVDGRSASGKSTLAAVLEAAIPGAAVVHTDDVAWHEPHFAWGHLLRDGVLQPLAQGRPVDFTPPAWRPHGRAGSMRLPAGLAAVIVEGVGASQEAVAGLVDGAIWVQSDEDEARRRGIERDLATGVNGDREQAIAFWDEWMAHEVGFLAADRPWQRADLVVAGTPAIDLAPAEVAVARGNRR